MRRSRRDGCTVRSIDFFFRITLKQKKMTWPSYARALQLVTYRATPKVETFEPDAVELGRAQRTDTDLHDSSPSSAQRFGWFTYCRTKDPIDVPSEAYETCHHFLRDNLFPAYEFDDRTNQEGLYDYDETPSAPNPSSPIAIRPRNLFGGDDPPSSSSDPVAPDNRKPLKGRRLFEDDSPSSSSESARIEYERKDRATAKTKMGFHADELRKNTMFRYKLRQNINLLDMSDLGTYEHILGELGTGRQHILTDVFLNQQGEIRRQSDLEKDLRLASKLVDLGIVGDNPNQSQGWYHDTMLMVSDPHDKTPASSRHNRELVLYNPTNWVGEGFSGKMRVSDHPHGTPFKA